MRAVIFLQKFQEKNPTGSNFPQFFSFDLGKNNYEI